MIRAYPSVFVLAASSLLHTSSVAVGGVPFHDAVSASGPILWYRFDEPIAAQSIVNHGSLGPAFDGVLVNGVTLESSSAAGDGAASFDHTQFQYVQSLSVAPASLGGNPSFSVEAVVRIDADYVNPVPTSYPPFLHWGTGLTGKEVYFSLWSNSSDRCYAGFYNGGLRMVDAFAPGCYHHFAWVRDAAGGANGQYEGSTFYVDGHPVDLVPDAVLPGAPNIDVVPTVFRIQKGADYSRYFSGQVDEVALYDRLLSPAEVLAHANALKFPCSCTGDLDGDGIVGAADLAVVLGSWLATESVADLDGSGTVDAADLGVLLGAWGLCP